MTQAETMGLVLDGILLLILVVSLFAGARKGFAAILIKMLAWIISAAIAWFGSSALAGLLYKLWLGPWLESQVTTAIASSSAPEQIASALTGQLGELPLVVKNAVSFNGVNLSEQINQIAQNSKTEIPALVNSQIVRPAATALLTGVLFLILFGVLFGLISKCSRSLSGRWHMPVIGQLNAFLGGTLGLLEGLVSAVMLLLVCQLVAAMTGGQMPFFNQATLSHSIAGQYILPLLPKW